MYQIGCSINKNAKQLHNLFSDILEEVTLNPDFIESFKLQLNTIYKAVNDERETISGEVKQKIMEINEKIEKLEERFAIGEIESDLYKKIKVKFMKERVSWMFSHAPSHFPPRTWKIM